MDSKTRSQIATALRAAAAKLVASDPTGKQAEPDADLFHLRKPRRRNPQTQVATGELVEAYRAGKRLHAAYPSSWGRFFDKDISYFIDRSRFDRAGVEEKLNFAQDRRGEGDADALMRLIEESRPYADSENVAVQAFFSHGIRGWEVPKLETGFRYGPPPEGGRSYNFRDRHLEDGVSVAHIKGQPESHWHRVFFGEQDLYEVTGYLREDKTGSDGEPLFVAISKFRKVSESSGHIHDR